MVPASAVQHLVGEAEAAAQLAHPRPALQRLTPALDLALQNLAEQAQPWLHRAQDPSGAAAPEHSLPLDPQQLAELREKLQRSDL